MIRFDGVIIDRKRGTITHDGTLQFKVNRRGETSYYFRLACALILAGIKNKRELFDLLYSDAPDGGPLNDRKDIGVRIHRLRGRLASIGIDLRWELGPGGRRYFAEPAICSEMPFLEAAE